jgi:hypothetical protein
MPTHSSPLITEVQDRHVKLSHTTFKVLVLERVEVEYVLLGVIMDGYHFIRAQKLRGMVIWHNQAFSVMMDNHGLRQNWNPIPQPVQEGCSRTIGIHRLAMSLRGQVSNIPVTSFLQPHGSKEVPVWGRRLIKVRHGVQVLDAQRVKVEELQSKTGKLMDMGSLEPHL